MERGKNKEKSAEWCFVIWLIIGTMLSGCIEEYEADIPAGDSDLLVVEGTICSGTLSKFTLSRTQPVNALNMPLMVVGAKVSVRGSNGTEYVMEDDQGCYSCTMETLDPDVAYCLHIETDGDVYESEPQKPLLTEKIADVSGVQITPQSNIDILVTPDEPIEADRTNYYSWTYDETWEVHSDYTTNIYFDKDLMTRCYQYDQFPSRGWKDDTNTTIMVGASRNYEGQHIKRLKMYDINRSDERMYYRYSCLVHQRAITKAEYEYELARLQAGSEMGGLFTPQPASLPTNIRCLTSQKRAIGFVGCSLNTTDYRFFLKASDFSISRPRGDTRKWLIGPSKEDCLGMVKKGFFLCEWIDASSPLQTAWAYQFQLDVRYKGAYIEKPDFWIYE